MATSVEQLEAEVSSLSPADLAKFRAWYASFDAESWDRQIERDASAGKLDFFADEAMKAHRQGKTRPL